MNKEDRELLLKDLCSRLPHKVKVLDDMGRTYELQIGNSYLTDLFYSNGEYVEVPIRPYLRPMSSMTDEERKEYKRLVAFSGSSYGAANFIDWLNKKMFDYRGLIDKCLAIEAPKDMYN